MSEKYYIHQKSTQTLVFNITTKSLVDGVETDNVFDLTGYDFILLLKKTRDAADADAVITKTVAIDATALTATIELTPADTDVPAGTYYMGTRYHLDDDNSIEGTSYTIEVRRAITDPPA